MNKDRAKMKQIDKDKNYVIKKVRITVEGERKGIRGFLRKMRKRSALLQWKLIVQKKEGNNA